MGIRCMSHVLLLNREFVSRCREVCGRTVWAMIHVAAVLGVRSRRHVFFFADMLELFAHFHDPRRDDGRCVLPQGRSRDNVFFPQNC